MKPIVNERNKNILASKVEVCDTLTTRLMGLMGRKSFQEGHGMLIKRSGNSIHTFFMNFAIDIVFISKNGEVKDIKENIKPWRLVAARTFSPTDALELPAGTVKKTQTQRGDFLRVEA